MNTNDTERKMPPENRIDGIGIFRNVARHELKQLLPDVPDNVMLWLNKALTAAAELGESHVKRNELATAQERIAELELDLASVLSESDAERIQSLVESGFKLAEMNERLRAKLDSANAAAAGMREALEAHDKWRRKEENQGQSKEGYRELWLCKATKQALSTDHGTEVLERLRKAEENVGELRLEASTLQAKLLRAETDSSTLNNAFNLSVKQREAAEERCRALEEAAIAAVEEWDEQIDRFIEALGEDNPRLHAMDERVRLLKAATLPALSPPATTASQPENRIEGMVE